MVVVTTIPSSPPRAASRAPSPLPPSPPHSIVVSNNNDSDNGNGNDNECCLDKFTRWNGHNFERSEMPTRILFYMNECWEDFKGEVLESLRSGFSGGKSLLPLEIEGAWYAFDFKRMLQIHLASENRRSIAWIDAKGKPFFPAWFLSHDFSQGRPKKRYKSSSSTIHD